MHNEALFTITHSTKVDKAGYLQVYYEETGESRKKVNLRRIEASEIETIDFSIFKKVTFKKVLEFEENLKVRFPLSVNPDT